MGTHPSERCLPRRTHTSRAARTSTFSCPSRDHECPTVPRGASPHHSLGNPPKTGDLCQERLSRSGGGSPPKTSREIQRPLHPKGVLSSARLLVCQSNGTPPIQLPD